MSLDPSFIRPAPTVPAAGPKGAPFGQPRGSTPGPGALPAVERVEVLRLQEGDSLIVHVDGAAGLSAGGADQLGRELRRKLRLGDLPFDVPVVVVSPGIRVTVARPG